MIRIDDKGYEGSSVLGKAYKVIRPLAEDLLVIDEEGEDIARRFVPIKLPPAARGEAASG